MPNPEKAEHIAKCLELAILLEVSANKPGNVSFTVGFEGTRVEHFLASAVAAHSSFREAASRGVGVSEGKVRLDHVGMGQLIRDCVADISVWQRGGNTLLGTVMLFVPIAVAAGMTPTSEGHKFNFEQLRKNIGLAVEATTAEDAVNVYKAIDIAKPSGLNVAPDLDVTASDSVERIRRENVTLLQVFQIAAGYDDICSEWVRNYPITFDSAYPYLSKQLESKDLNTAVVHTFLKILSEHPDTFIARKAGLEKAREVSSDAKLVLDLGGLETAEGKRSLTEFDQKLRASGNRLNPGTTADLTAAALALCILSGYRP
ncbi:MAG: triphosphoribosyl-dephospho-CoA synthase [Candidatus Bathyarchaeota archaeon]|nr:triphosphoribosyl-dephospho-CoA synthase [Candidatus Bathyarchaeota archaeon]